MAASQPFSYNHRRDICLSDPQDMSAVEPQAFRSVADLGSVFSIRVSKIACLPQKTHQRAC